MTAPNQTVINNTDCYCNMLWRYNLLRQFKKKYFVKRFLRHQHRKKKQIFKLCNTCHVNHVNWQHEPGLSFTPYLHAKKRGKSTTQPIYNILLVLKGCILYYIFHRVTLKRDQVFGSKHHKFSGCTKNVRYLNSQSTTLSKKQKIKGNIRTCAVMASSLYHDFGF